MRHLLPPLALLLWLSLSFSATAWAQQDVQVQAQASPRVVGPGATVTYTISASVQGNYDIALREAPDFGSFQVVGTSQAPSFMVQGGQATRSLTLTYQLRAPRQAGEYTIGSPRLMVGTRTFSPTPIAIRVTSSAPPADEPRRPESADAFVEIDVEPDRAPYVGEQITLRYVLMTDQSGPRYRARHPDDPDLDDFWVVDLAGQHRTLNRQVQRDGRRFLANTIRTLAVFPLRPGTATLDGLDLPLVRASFFGSADEILAPGISREIEVQPLPEGSPPGFTDGNVGTWQLNAQVDTRRSQVGSQITLTARIQGQGRPNRLAPPILENAEAFEVLSVDDTGSQEVQGARVGGWRTFTFRLMPLEEGTLNLPTVAFPFFDPTQEEYITHRAELGALEVAPGALPEPRTEEPLEAAADPLAWTAKLHGPLEPGSLRPAEAGPPFPILLYLLPILGLVLLLLESMISPRLAPGRRAARRRKRLLAEAHRLLGSPTDATAEGAMKALRLLLTEAFGARIGALTPAEVVSEARRLHLPDELVADLQSLTDSLTRSRYGGHSLDSQAIHDQTRALILALLEVAAPEKPLNSRSTTLAVVLLAGLTATAVLATSPLVHASESRDATRYFNEGTAAAKAGDLGRARLYLERARHLAKPHPSLAENHSLVVTAVARQDPSVASFAAQDFSTSVLRAALPLLLALILWMALGFGVLARFSPRFRRLGLSGAALCLVSAALFAYAEHRTSTFEESADLAVLLGADQSLRSGPSSHAATISTTTLPAGSILRLRDTRDQWSLFETPAGDKGWLANSAAELIAP